MTCLADAVLRHAAASCEAGAGDASAVACERCGVAWRQRIFPGPEKRRGAPCGAPRTCIVAKTYIAGIIGATVFLRRRAFLRPAFLRVPFLRPAFLRVPFLRPAFLRVPFLRPAFLRCPSYARPSCGRRASSLLASALPPFCTRNVASLAPAFRSCAATSRAHSVHRSPAEEQPMKDRKRQAQGRRFQSTSQDRSRQKTRQQKN